MAARPGSRNGIYLCVALTGGGAQTLDAIQITGAGTPNTYDLIDGDAAMVVIEGNFYCYRFNATSTEAESSPDYIRPDDYVDAGVWVLITYGESPSSDATGFFDSGTIEHERGGLEADVSAYDGLVKISGGTTSQAVVGTDYLDPDHINVGGDSEISEIDGEMVFSDPENPDGITLSNLVNGIAGTPFFIYRLWRYSTPGLDAVYSPPVYVSDFEIPSLSYDGPVVIFGSNDGYVYCINGEDGTLLWRVDLGDPITGRCQVADVDGDGYYEIIVGVSSGSGEIYCLEDSGLTKWSTSYSETFAHAGELVDESGSWYLYAVSHDGTCIKLDASDGSEEWTPYSTAGGGGALAYPVVIDVDDDSTLEMIFAADDGYVYCINGGTGGLEWSYDLGTSSAALVVVYDIDGDSDYEIIVGCRDGRVYVLSHAGALQDKSPILSAYGYKNVDGAVALFNDDFIAGGAAGIVQRFDCECESAWRYDIRGSISADILLADVNYDSINELVLFDEAGQLTALTPTGGFIGKELFRGGIYGTPILEDVDSDSQIEMVVSTVDGYVEMWRFDDPSLTHVYCMGYNAGYLLYNISSSGIAMNEVWNVSIPSSYHILAASPTILCGIYSSYLRRFSSTDGSVLWAVTPPTTPDNIMISVSNYIYACDFSEKTIYKYNSFGVLEDTITIGLTGAKYIKYLCLDSDGNFLGVYVTETSAPYYAYAFKIDSSGTVLWESSNIFSGNYASTVSCAIDANGDFYVTSTLKGIYPIDGETGSIGSSFGTTGEYNNTISIDNTQIYQAVADAPYNDKTYFRAYNLSTHAQAWTKTITGSISYNQITGSYAEDGYCYLYSQNASSTFYKYSAAGTLIDTYDVNNLTSGKYITLSVGLIGEGHWA